MNNNFEAFKKIAGGRIIGFNAEYAKIFNATTAILLCQAAYYDCSIEERAKLFLTDKSGNKDLYFDHTDAQWLDETGLSEHELRAAKNKLASAGVLVWVRAGLPARTYYRVDFERLQDVVSSHIKARESLVTRPENLSGLDEINSPVIIDDKSTDYKKDYIISGTPETDDSGETNPSENISTSLVSESPNTEKPAESKKPKTTSLVSSDAFEKETESNTISKFLLAFCRFIKSSEQRKDLRKETVLAVRSEAKRLIEKKITPDQLLAFERWYKSTFAGEKREAGQVLGYGYVRENWSAFEAACGVQGGVGIHMPAKTSDSRHEIRFSPDGNTVEIWNKQNGSLLRRMSLDQYRAAFGGGAK